MPCYTEYCSNLDHWFKRETYTMLTESIKSYIETRTGIMEADFRNGHIFILILLLPAPPLLLFPWIVSLLWTLKMLPQPMYVHFFLYTIFQCLLTVCFLTIWIIHRPGFRKYDLSPILIDLLSICPVQNISKYDLIHSDYFSMSCPTSYFRG